MASKSASDVMIELLRRINRNLESLSGKFDRMMEMQQALVPKSKQMQPSVSELPLDVTTLLSLPDHLRKTAMAIARIGEATATQIAKETGRVRAVESDYLNQLVSMGHLAKRRKGRDVYFRVEEQ